MDFNPKAALAAAKDIAANAVDKASDIVENAGVIIRGDLVGGVSGIVQNSVDIADHAVQKVKDVLTGKDTDEQV